MFHLAAWGQTVQNANALTPINAIQDQAITTQGVDVRVPLDLPFIVAEACLYNDASGARAEVQSPSLRAMLNLDVEPIILGKIFGTIPESYVHADSPVPVVPNESLNFAVQGAEAGAVIHYGFVMLADGPLPYVKGNIYTVRATSAVALAVNTWVNGNLTFAQVLPAGSYKVVGMRARGANLAAARLVFPGSKYRPGVFAVNTVAQPDPLNQRYGYMGTFGQFDNTVPPTVDCLGDTDATQFFDFDLIKVK